MDKNNESLPKDYKLLKYLAGLFKEIGLTGFLVVVLTFIFIVFANDNQKSEFIDRYFLMKNVEESPFPFIIIVTSLLLVIIFSFAICRARNKLKSDEIKRISSEKSKLQEILLEKNLHSSE